MSGQTPLAPGTLESYLDTVRRAGAPSGLPVRDLGQHTAVLEP